MELDENKQFNILIVDDNPKNIQVIGNVLREVGYLAGFATDGKQALNLLQKTNDYDLVLLDIEMPVMDGYETCKAMRNDANLKDIPVIFLTAYSDIESIIIGFEAGAQDYVTKPFNSKILLARVDTHLQLKRKTDLVKRMNQSLEGTVEERTNELKTAYNELHRLSNLKTDFMILISREIRAPLNGIVGTINLIKNQEHSSALKSLIETLDISVAKLEEFTYKAMLYTQLSSNKYNTEMSNINLKELVQYSIIEVSSLVQAKNNHLITDGVSGDIFLNGDRDLLFNAFVYILHNAIANSPQNAKIVIEVKSIDNKTICSFLDYGAGFPQEVLARVFQPFHFEDGLPDVKGGLSLYIVKEIMDIHLGEIKIFNKEGAGACVELVFKS